MYLMTFYFGSAFYHDEYDARRCWDETVWDISFRPSISALAFNGAGVRVCL